ncbi:hypothetical protein MACJ_003603 [Theileria orientalis]|uniref:Uncharacterized protein n=1 Tax=Theileria orientalis TaxID=68886 RepID=A0A976SLG0_THEOR|nr:hypothetical protein MACJ_003603 [Theileria orientalis]
MNLYGKFPCLILYIFLCISPIKVEQALVLNPDIDNTGHISGKNIKTGSSRKGHGITGSTDHNHTQLLNHSRVSNQEICLVSVNIRETESTDDVYYEYNESKGTHIFTPNHGCLVKKVFKGGKILWDSKDFNYQYGEHVYVGTNEYSEPVFRVYFPRAEILLDPQEHDPKMVSVDLKHKHSNGFFTYNYNAQLQTHTFTPNPPYVFYRATKGDQVVWKHETGEYPERLLIVPDEHGQSVLRLEFPKSESTATGGEVEVRDPLEGIEIITHGSLNPNDSTKYTVKIQNNTCLFRFKEGAMCTEVRYMGEKVWRHGDFGYLEYPQSIGYFTHKIIDVYMGGPMIFYERDAKGVWKGKESDILIYVEDPKNPKKIRQISIDDYDLRIEHGDVDFLFYKGVKCKKIKHRDETLWKHDGEEYPSSLTYIEDNMVYIYFSNSFLLYIRDEDGEWIDHRSDDIYKYSIQPYHNPPSRFDLFKWVDKYV